MASPYLIHRLSAQQPQAYACLIGFKRAHALPAKAALPNASKAATSRLTGRMARNEEQRDLPVGGLMDIANLLG